ncbi:SPOR domain-containing protein [Persephonella sp.]
MKKKYLISALVVGVALFDLHTFHYFEKQASAGIDTESSKGSDKKLPEPISLTEKIYRVRMLLAQVNTQNSTSEKFETIVKDFYYSLQFGTFKKREMAEKFLQKLPEDIRQNSFIYRTEKGMYAVRYGLFDDYNILKEIQEKLPVSSIIVKTDSSKIIETKEKKISEEKRAPQIKKEKTKKERKPFSPAEEEVKIIPEFEEEEIQLFEEEKPKIPLYKKIIGAIFFIPAYMWTHKQRGFWGKVEFSYKAENYKDQYRKTTKNAFRQYYELNYEGFVYSPRLLIYKLGVNYTQEDANIDTNGSKTKSKFKLTGYDVEFNFLRNSKFPFSIFFNKKQSPLWYTYYGRTSYTERTTRAYGFFGNVSLKDLSLGYSYRKIKSNSIGLDFSENRKTDEYTLSFRKNQANSYLSATYKKTIEKYTQYFLTAGTSRYVNQDIDNLNVVHQWFGSKDKRVNSELRYYANTYSNTKNLTANSRLYWNPNENLSSTWGLSATRTESKGYNMNFLTFSEGLFYRVNKNWSVNQNLMLYTSSGSSSNQNIVNTGININYNKLLSDTFSVFGGTGFNFQAQTGNINRIGGTATVSGGLNKRFDFLSSNFSLTGSASEYKTNKNDKTTSINLSERFYAHILSNLSFEHSVSYYYLDSKIARVDIPGEYNTSNYENIEIANALRYWRMLGWKGKLNSSVGIKYYTGKNRQDRIYPYGNLTISYKVIRNMLYKMSLDVYRDTYYNANYARLKSKLDYKFRSFYFEWDLQYYYENSQVYGERKNYITTFKVYRVF